MKCRYALMKKTCYHACMTTSFDICSRLWFHINSGCVVPPPAAGNWAPADSLPASVCLRCPPPTPGRLCSQSSSSSRTATTSDRRRPKYSVYTCMNTSQAFIVSLPGKIHTLMWAHFSSGHGWQKIISHPEGGHSWPVNCVCAVKDWLLPKPCSALGYGYIVCCYFMVVSFPWLMHWSTCWQILRLFINMITTLQNCYIWRILIFLIL